MIKYVLIVYETKRILCEYKEDEIPNIQKILRNILDNHIKPDETSSRIYDKEFTIFYKNDSLITILCVTDLNYPSQTAYDFLNDLVNIFRKEYKEEEIRQAYSYAYNISFKKIIKQKVKYYNTNLDSKDLTNLDRLKDSFLDMKNKLIDTVVILSERESELSHNVEKAVDLKKATDDLLINARKAKKAEINNSPYKKLIPIIITIVVAYCILAIVCGGVCMPNCSI